MLGCHVAEISSCALSTARIISIGKVLLHDEILECTDERIFLIEHAMKLTEHGSQ